MATKISNASVRKVKTQVFAFVVSLNIILVILWMFFPIIKQTSWDFFAFTIPFTYTLTTNESILSPLLIFTFTIPLMAGLIIKMRLSKTPEVNKIAKRVVIFSWIISAAITLFAPFVLAIIQFLVECSGKTC